MILNKHVRRTIIVIPILILFFIACLKFVTTSDKNIENIEDSELYIISKGGDGTYTDGLVRYGFMNKDGDIVIEAKYKNVSEFFEGVAYVQDTNDNGYLIDKDENKISTVEGVCLGLYDGLFLIKVDNKWGYIDKSGEWIIKPSYESIDVFTEGLAEAQLNGKWGFIDKSGKWIIEPSYESVESFTEGLAAVELNGKWGFIDKSGKWIIEPSYESVESFTEGLAAVKANEKWGYIDKSEEWIIEPFFHEASALKNGYAIVGVYDINHDFKQGVINKKGEFIIEAKYDGVYLDSFDKGGFIFYEKGLFGVLNLTGEVAIEPKYTCFIRQGENKIFMDTDTIYFLDENLNTKNKYKLGKAFPKYYDNKLIQLMTKDGLWYFNKGGELIIKMHGDFSKGFEIVNGLN